MGVIWERWRRGLAVGAGLAAAAFALAVTFGAFAVQAGLHPALAIAMSALAFSGSAQFAFVTSLSGGGGIGAGLGAATLMNLRFVPMAAACAPALRGGRLRRGVEAQLVVDGSWAAAQRPDGTVERDVLVPATLVQWPVWVGGTAIGALGAPSLELTHRLGLDAVFPAFFAVLLVDVLRQRPALRPRIAAGAAVACASLWVVPVGVAMLLGALPALLPGRRGE